MVFFSFLNELDRRKELCSSKLVLFLKDLNRRKRTTLFGNLFHFFEELDTRKGPLLQRTLIMIYERPCLVIGSHHIG